MVAAFVVLGGLVGVGLVTHDTAPSAARSDAPYAAGTTGAATGPGTPGSQSQEPTSALTGSSKRPSNTPSPSESTSKSKTPKPDDPTSSAALESRIAAPTGAATSQPPPSSPAPSSEEPSSQAPSASDGTAPETSASTLSSNADAWTISVGSNESSTYECSLDGGAYQACGTTVTYRDLDRGWHTFAARATDDAGNTDPSPAELSTKITGAGSSKG